MGQPMHVKFQKRFGDRISVIYTDKTPPPAIQKIQNEFLAKAIFQVLSGILNREPTQDELLGRVDLSTAKRRRKT